MREPIRDRGRLEHILSAITNIDEYVSGLSKQEFFADKLRMHATVYNVQVIGEASYKLSKDFKSAHPETPWAMIEKMRHILVHDYYQVNNEILWVVINDDIPPLKHNIMKYMESM